MSKNIEKIFGPWKDGKIKDKFKDSKEHKFLDRDRTLKINILRLNEYIPDIINSSKNKKILDVASGNGATLEVLRFYGHDVVGIDYSPGFENGDWLYKPMIESQGLKCINHDGSVIPYPFNDNEFDFLICFGAITFFKPVEKWPKILDEFSRISKEGILLGINVGPIYELGKKYVENWSSNKFTLVKKNKSIYRWDKK